MLLAAHDLIGTPVMSLQTGVELATVVNLIIDPSTLSILAYELEGSHLDITPAFLKIEDIRELSDVGFIIDSSDELLTLDDIVNNADDYKNPVQLENMKVVDTVGARLGKVEIAIMNTETFRIDQLQVRQPFFKSFTDTSLLIHRSQIVDIHDSTVVVRAATLTHADSKQSRSRQRPLNPFSGAAPPQPESAKTDRR